MNKEQQDAKKKQEIEDLIASKRSIDKKKASIDQIIYFINRALQVCKTDFSEVKQHLIAASNLLTKADGKLISRAKTTNEFIEKAQSNTKNWNQMLIDGLAKKLSELQNESEDRQDAVED